MSKYRAVEVDNDGGRSYDLSYILDNPIPARCKKCKRIFVEGSDGAIHAPALSGCRCFYCSGELMPLERGGPATVEQVEQQRSREKQQPMLEVF